MAMGWVDPWVGLGWVEFFSNMINCHTALSCNHDYFSIPITFHIYKYILLNTDD